MNVYEVYVQRIYSLIFGAKMKVLSERPLKVR